MGIADDLIQVAMESDEDFQRMLSRVIKKDLKMSVLEFSEKSSISPSTLYKILSGSREPNLRTLRDIVNTIRGLTDEKRTEFIGVIAARPVLDKMEERIVRIGDRLITIREYPAATVEEAILAAIKAERDGATAVVCAPIVCPTVEKILHIPITAIVPRSSLLDAIEFAVKKYL
ncbi:MAG: helix-turn-helix domain-containing protein [Halobacteriota archaeon]|nr:helix-turn-helix domain-containing protein [Halobacteriota archaeon]